MLHLECKKSDILCICLYVLQLELDTTFQTSHRVHRDKDGNVLQTLEDDDGRKILAAMSPGGNFITNVLVLF